MMRALQIASAVFALLAVMPLLLVIWCLVKITSRGPGLYCSQRLGIHKKSITIWKFRTMINSVSPDIQERIHHVLENSEGQKFRHDVRITPLGGVLRHFSLDELPQIWNVLNGTMNWIGPRPIILEEDSRYGRYSDEIHKVKPGITGLWQVSGRCLLTYHRRIAINLYYVRHSSWKLDLWILWKTIGAVFSGRGAF